MTKQPTRNPADFGKVAVLMGGWSAEREISLKSGQAVLEALQARHVDAQGIDVGKDILVRLAKERFDRAFIALHGRGGEDGVIQGALEVLGLPYTGSGVLGSALAMDKRRTKLIWRQLDLPTPPHATITADTDLEAVVRQVGLPLAVKPVHEGSSIGMSKVTQAGELVSACEIGFECDAILIAERWIAGGEYTAGVLGEEMLPLIRLETPRTFYDYEAKYFTDTTRYHCPSGLPREEEQNLQALCRCAFVASGASGWGRVDLMLDEDRRPWLLEVNTVPGMTDHSLVPMAAKVAGLDFEALTIRILETAT